MENRPQISNLSYALRGVHIGDDQQNDNNNNNVNNSTLGNSNNNNNNNDTIRDNLVVSEEDDVTQNRQINSNANRNASLEAEIIRQSNSNSKISNFFQNQPTGGITLFSHRSAPNGFKVAIVLSELNLKYQTFFLDFNSGEQRAPEFVSINPNARVPAIIDHDNDNLAVWESGAIIIYLVEKYLEIERQNGKRNPSCPLYSNNFSERSQILSWLFFQTSGHAPMIGQALHFRYFHTQSVPSAVERYTDEVRRVYGVIEMALAERREVLIMELDSENAAAYSSGITPLSQSKFFDYPVWLVGDHVSVADLSFVPWNNVVDRVGINIKVEFPEVYKWTKHMMRRPSVIRALRGD